MSGGRLEESGCTIGLGVRGGCKNPSCKSKGLGVDTTDAAMQSAVTLAQEKKPRGSLPAAFHCLSG